MRIAAGVLLILAGVFNGCAGTGYAFGGAAGAAAIEGSGALSKAMMEEAAKGGNADAKAAAEAMAEVNANANDAKAAAGGMMIFGFFLLVMLGLQIAGGPRAEADLLAAASLYEEAAGISTSVPIYPRASPG